MTSSAAENLQRAVALHGAGRMAEAESWYRRMLHDQPDHPDALQLLGLLRVQQGQTAAGVELMRRSLSSNADQPGVHSNLGNALVKLKQFDSAVEHFARAVELNPALSSAWVNHGGALLSLGRFEEAVASCSRAMSLFPHHVRPILNRAKAQESLGSFEAALGDYDRAIALRPDFAESHMRRAALLLGMGRPAEALESFQCALRYQSNSAESLSGSGHALWMLGRAAEALAAYADAIRMDPAFLAAYFSRGVLLSQHGLFEEAVTQLAALESVAPSYDFVTGLRLHVQMHVGDWATWGMDSSAISQSIEAGRRAAQPLPFLAISDSPELHLQCARINAEAMAGVPARLWNGERYGHERLRIGYLSADLTEHALAYLMAGVFEQHDQRRFEIIALSLRKDDASAMSRRTRAAFGRVIDVEGLNDLGVARIARGEEIDILVDLTGHTGGYHAGALACRPAPVQVNYLGFPGTLGPSIADYIIADEYLIPPESRQFYGESIAYLPACFQANDDRRAKAPVAPSRAKVGLPEAAFVWCSFHATYKINPPLFDVWIRLLLATPGSVLWLSFPHASAERNIRREAARHGLDPQRIVAAPKVPYPEHLARLGLADLCLDTWPFNGGATTSDALWACLPVVSRAGRSFAARMSGSLLRCAGIPELIAGSFEEYEQIALELALDEKRRLELRDRLTRNKTAGPLFDTRRFCGYLEAAYIEMHERCRRGEAPATFNVSGVA